MSKQQKIDLALHNRLGVLASQRKYRQALQLLDDVIENPLPLLQDHPWWPQVGDWRGFTA
jgi:hypothetical protein